MRHFLVHMKQDQNILEMVSLEYYWPPHTERKLISWKYPSRFTAVRVATTFHIANPDVKVWSFYSTCLQKLKRLEADQKAVLKTSKSKPFNLLTSHHICLETLCDLCMFDSHRDLFAWCLAKTPVLDTSVSGKTVKNRSLKLWTCLTGHLYRRICHLMI